MGNVRYELTGKSPSAFDASGSCIDDANVMIFCCGNQERSTWRVLDVRVLSKGNLSEAAENATGTRFGDGDLTECILYRQCRPVRAEAEARRILKGSERDDPLPCVHIGDDDAVASSGDEVPAVCQGEGMGPGKECLAGPAHGRTSRLPKARDHARDAIASKSVNRPVGLLHNPM